MVTIAIPAIFLFLMLSSPFSNAYARGVKIAAIMNMTGDDDNGDPAKPGVILKWNNHGDVYVKTVTP